MKEVLAVARRKDTELNFSFIYPDLDGNPRRKDVGSVHSTKKGQNDFKSLQELRFITGDYIDLTLYTK